MSTRKKWRLQLHPSGRLESASSKVKAYERVAWLREGYALGLSRIERVVVHVDEGDGWSIYERVAFPARDPATQ